MKNLNQFGQSLSDSNDRDDDYNLQKEEQNTTLPDILEWDDTDSSKSYGSNTKFKTVQKHKNSKRALYVSIQNFREESERTNKEINLLLIKDLLKEILSLSEQNAQKIIDTNQQLGFNTGKYKDDTNKVAGWEFKFEIDMAKATRMFEIASIKIYQVLFFFNAHKDYQLQKLNNYKYRKYQPNSIYSILDKIEQPQQNDFLQEQNNINRQPQQPIIEINFPVLNQNSKRNQDNIQKNQNRDNAEQIKILKEQIKQKGKEKIDKENQIGKLNEQIQQQQVFIEEMTLKIKQILK